MATASAQECSGNPIEVLLCTVGQYVSGPIEWVVSCAVIVATWFAVAEWRLLGQPGNPAFQKQIDRIRVKADGVSVANQYHDGLRSLLNDIDRLFGPISVAKQGSFSDRWFGCQPWTTLSYARLLNISCIYPAMFMLAGGFVSGEDGVFNAVSILVGYKAGSAIRPCWYRIVSFKPKLTAITFIIAVFFIIDDIPDTLVYFLLALVITVISTFTIDVVAVVGKTAYAVLMIFASNTAIFSAIAFADAIAALLAYYNVVDDVETVIVFISVGVYILILIISFVKALDWYDNFKQSTLNQRPWMFWAILSSTFIAVGLLFSIFNNEMTGLALIFLLLPVSNAVLDWLSLGLTRGLLLHIARGAHDSLSALLWALADITLALVLLIGVAASSFIAFWLAKTIASDHLISISVLPTIIAGGDPLSIGIWLMLVSTLIPTFIHFLVALLAFVSLPFSRLRVAEIANQLQVARDEAVLCIQDGNYQEAAAIPVDAFARRWAMAYFGVSRITVVILWLALVSFLSYVIYKIMQWMFVTLLG